MEPETNRVSGERRGPVYWLACALMFTLLTGMAGCPPAGPWDDGFERDGGGDGGGGGEGGGGGGGSY